MIWQMINLGKPRHLLYPSKSSISLQGGDRAHSEVLVNASKQSYRKTLLLECAGRGWGAGCGRSAHGSGSGYSRPGASFEIYLQSCKPNSLRGQRQQAPGRWGAISTRKQGLCLCNLRRRGGVVKHYRVNGTFSILYKNPFISINSS